MSSDVSYTTEEIAKLLKISKLTVYDLIKKKELSAYRVGKQMRIDASDLEAYKNKTKGIAASAAPSQDFSERATANGTIVITGQDVSLDILAKYLENKVQGIRPLRSYVGSLDSLVSMYKGESDIVSTHLWDGDTGEYNLPYIRRLLVGFPYLVVNLLCRDAGFYTAKGNPKQLQSWPDLKREGVKLVNREKGSGARVLLDEQLRIHGIQPEQINGYDMEVSNHMAAAGKVASGEADVGIGIEKAAKLVGSVEFIPLIKESYDLVMLKKKENSGWIDAAVQVIQSEPFQADLKSMGYDLSQTGKIRWET